MPFAQFYCTDTLHFSYIVDILRTGLMNCTYPLTESILMDTVRRDTRARWKSLESVTAFGWCGSAVIGGALADRYSYGK